MIFHVVFIISSIVFSVMEIYINHNGLFLKILDKLVIAGKTEAISSSVHGSYFPNKSVDGSVQQNNKYCSHTRDNTSITVAWLRTDLKNIYSIKTVKFWYRNDSTYTSLDLVT